MTEFAVWKITSMAGHMVNPRWLDSYVHVVVWRVIIVGVVLHVQIS